MNRYFHFNLLLAIIALTSSFTEAGSQAIGRLEPLSASVIRESPVAVHIHQTAQRWTSELLVDSLAASGVKWLRLDHLTWENIEVVKKDSFYLENAAIVLDRIQQRGVKAIALVGGGNELYNLYGIPKRNDKSYDEFLKYVDTVAKRFGTTIDYWQIGKAVNAAETNPKLTAAEFAQIYLDVSGIIRQYSLRGQFIVGGISGLDASYITDLVSAGIFANANYLGLELIDLNNIPERNGGYSGTSELSTAVTRINEIINNSRIGLVFTEVGYASELYPKYTYYNLETSPASQACYLSRIYCLGRLFDVKFIIQTDAVDKWGESFAVPLAGMESAAWGLYRPYNAQAIAQDIPLQNMVLSGGANLQTINDKLSIYFPEARSNAKVRFNVPSYGFYQMWMDVHTSIAGSPFRLKDNNIIDTFGTNYPYYLAQCYVQNSIHAVPVRKVTAPKETHIFEFNGPNTIYDFDINPLTQGQLYLDRFYFYQYNLIPKQAQYSVRSVAAIFADAVRLKDVNLKTENLVPPQAGMSSGFYHFELDQTKYGKMVIYWLATPYAKDNGSIDIGTPAGFLSDPILIDLDSGLGYKGYRKQISNQYSWVRGLPLSATPRAIVDERTFGGSFGIEDGNEKFTFNVGQISENAIKLQFAYPSVRRIQIFNLSGQLVGSTDECSETAPIVRLSEHQAGVLFVKVSEGSLSSVRKLVLIY